MYQRTQSSMMSAWNTRLRYIGSRAIGFVIQHLGQTRSGSLSDAPGCTRTGEPEAVDFFVFGVCGALEQKVLWSANIQSRTGRCERILVMQSGKDRFRMDSVRLFATMARTRLLLVAERRRRIGNTRTECHVRAAGIVMGNPRFQNGPQVRFGKRNQPIQALATNCADDSLADGIGFRTVRWRFQHGHAEPLYRFIEVLGEDAVAIVQ